MVLVHEQPAVEPAARGPFKEARRREQRRRAVLTAVLPIVVGGALAGVVLLSSGGSGKLVRAHQRLAGLVATAATVALEQPASLAVSMAGVLYVLDPSRDQILRRLRDGRFAVVAGSGRRGFSGDGGRATRAALRLTGSSDVAIGAEGTVYFTDSDNNRVRAVLPDGRIQTVAGDGRRIPHNVNAPYLTGSRPALRTELVEPTGLAFGPGGKLYVAAQDVVALSRRGTLSYFAGSTHAGYSAESRLIDGYPTGITFDRAGDMFVSSFPSLLERTASGRVLFLGDGFRSAGGLGILASSPPGDVYAGFGNAAGFVDRLTRARPVLNGDVMSMRGLHDVTAPGALNRVLGTRGTIQNGFGPSGLAISRNGTIYTDTDSGYWSSVSALVEITPGGHVRPLWTSR